MGIDVSRYKIVAFKSSNRFRAGFQDLAREIVAADPPGLTTLRVEIFPKRNKPGPLWPMDQDVQYRPREARPRRKGNRRHRPLPIGGTRSDANTNKSGQAEDEEF
jgi:hypothetical protein